MNEASRRVKAGRLDDFSPGRPTRVEIDGRGAVVVRVGAAVYACGDTCAHQGGPLGEGRLSGTRLACPWHGWMYDVRTGACVLPGRGARVPTYPAVVLDDEVWLELDGPGGQPSCSP